MKVYNFGSLNIDYSFQVDHLVLPGETESSSSFQINCGGKGLNQSIALKKAGIDVIHIGLVGRSDSKMIFDLLKKENIDTTHIKKKNTNTGSAFIQVDKNGENNIVLNGGANHLVDKKFIDESLKDAKENDYLVIQNEISSLKYLIEKASKLKMRIIFNPSPMNDSIFSLPLDKIYMFFLNKDESINLAKNKKNTLNTLINKYPNSQFVITSGSKESIYYDLKNIYKETPSKITPVDTTAAGDTFLGYFLASYIRGENRPLLVANTASSLTCLKRGASISIPYKDEVYLKIKEEYQN